MVRNLQVELADRPLGLMPSHAWNSLANRGRHLLQTVSLDGQECLCASLGGRDERAHASHYTSAELSSPLLSISGLFSSHLHVFTDGNVRGILVPGLLCKFFVQTLATGRRRKKIGSIGLITLLISIFLFLRPDLMMRVWPWKLTLLTARVMSGLFALTGVGELCIALDARWSAVRIALQSQMIGMAAIVVAIFVSWSNFDQANILTWGFVGGMLFLLIASPMLYLWLEGRRRKGAVRL